MTDYGIVKRYPILVGNLFLAAFVALSTPLKAAAFPIYFPSWTGFNPESYWNNTNSLTQEAWAAHSRAGESIYVLKNGAYILDHQLYDGLAINSVPTWVKGLGVSATAWSATHFGVENHVRTFAYNAGQDIVDNSASEAVSFWKDTITVSDAGRFDFSFSYKAQTNNDPLLFGPESRATAISGWVHWNFGVYEKYTNHKVAGFLVRQDSATGNLNLQNSIDCVKDFYGGYTADFDCYSSGGVENYYNKTYLGIAYDGKADTDFVLSPYLKEGVYELRSMLGAVSFNQVWARQTAIDAQARLEDIRSTEGKLWSTWEGFEVAAPGVYQYNMKAALPVPEPDLYLMLLAGGCVLAVARKKPNLTSV